MEMQEILGLPLALPDGVDWVNAVDIVDMVDSAHNGPAPARLGLGPRSWYQTLSPNDKRIPFPPA